MKIVNSGEVKIGRLTTRAGTTVENHGTVTIDEHVCLTGEWRPGEGTTHIKARYIPKGSTCAIHDNASVTVDGTFFTAPPGGTDHPAITTLGGKHDSNITF
jgi:hypothetical protein